MIKLQNLGNFRRLSILKNYCTAAIKQEHRLQKVIPNNFCKYLEKITDQHQTLVDHKIGYTIREPYSSLKSQILEYQELCNLLNSDQDEEMILLAESDIQSLLEDLKKTVDYISSLIIPPEQFDKQNAIMEVVPGAGGLEATMFAEEIFHMYLNYVQSLGCEVEILELVHSTVGKQSKFVSSTGIVKGSALITGQDVFRNMKFECGVHRVQRVPVTGTKSDRLQTSTCSVAVLPEPSDVDIILKDKDLKFEFMRSSGAGGQSVNVTNSACRVTHLPTGLAVDCQEERSQIQNKAKAVRKLKSRLNQIDFEKEISSSSSSRKLQIGNMNRNEKIRTYNYNRHMLTDHRIGDSRVLQNISSFIIGDLGFTVIQDFHAQLEEQDRAERLEHLLKSID